MTLEISVPNTFTPIQLQQLKSLSQSYGGIVVEGEKVTFPSFEVDEGESAEGSMKLVDELCRKATKF